MLEDASHRVLGNLPNRPEHSGSHPVNVSLLSPPSTRIIFNHLPSSSSHPTYSSPVVSSSVPGSAKIPVEWGKHVNMQPSLHDIQRNHYGPPYMANQPQPLSAASTSSSSSWSSAVPALLSSSSAFTSPGIQSANALPPLLHRSTKNPITTSINFPAPSSASFSSFSPSAHANASAASVVSPANDEDDSRAKKRELRKIRKRLREESALLQLKQPKNFASSSPSSSTSSPSSANETTASTESISGDDEVVELQALNFRRQHQFSASSSSSAHSLSVSSSTKIAHASSSSDSIERIRRRKRAFELLCHEYEQVCGTQMAKALGGHRHNDKSKQHKKDRSKHQIEDESDDDESSFKSRRVSYLPSSSSSSSSSSNWMKHKEASADDSDQEDAEEQGESLQSPHLPADLLHAVDALKMLAAHFSPLDRVVPEQVVSITSSSSSALEAPSSSLPSPDASARESQSSSRVTANDPITNSLSPIHISLNGTHARDSSLHPTAGSSSSSLTSSSCSASVPSSNPSISLLPATSIASSSSSAAFPADSNPNAAVLVNRDSYLFDRALPLSSIDTLMRSVLPVHAVINDDARNLVLKASAEFIAFLTSEAKDRASTNQRIIFSPLTSSSAALSSSGLVSAHDASVSVSADSSSDTSSFSSSALPNSFESDDLHKNKKESLLSNEAALDALCALGYQHYAVLCARHIQRYRQALTPAPFVSVDDRSSPSSTSVVSSLSSFPSLSKSSSLTPSFAASAPPDSSTPSSHCASSLVTRSPASNSHSVLEHTLKAHDIVYTGEALLQCAHRIEMTDVHSSAIIPDLYELPLIMSVQPPSSSPSPSSDSSSSVLSQSSSASELPKPSKPSRRTATAKREKTKHIDERGETRNQSIHDHDLQSRAAGNTEEPEKLKQRRNPRAHLQCDDDLMPMIDIDAPKKKRRNAVPTSTVQDSYDTTPFSNASFCVDATAGESEVAH